jgi:hypothetical protein
MLTISYAPAVLSALQAAFPTPPNRAKQQLDKYLALLEHEIRLSLLSRSSFARKFGAYDIALTKLTNSSPTLGNKKYRVHEWLSKNGLALVVNLNANANNITRQRAVLKPTALLRVQNDDLLAFLQKLNSSELTIYLDTLTADWNSLIADYQSEYRQLSAAESMAQYFSTPVDVTSLKKYMMDLVQGSSTMNRSQQENSLVQAEFVLRIAQANGGWLHQKIDKKAFGRTYLEGVSVLSVRKQVRMAMLGKCFEYDAKSCSTAWKMAFAAEWHAQKKTRQLTVRQSFAAMTVYLEDKDMFFQTVTAEVFNAQPAPDTTAKIKEAMTALGFGAKLSVGTWRGTSGQEQQSSLLEIFDRDRAVLKKFVNSNLVKTFNKEQQTLNKFIVEKFSGDAQWHTAMALEQQRKKLSQPFSTAQRVVWLYQHAETAMMDIVRREIAKSGNTVLANVHDAVVVRNQIPATLLAKIEREVQKKTGVAYFALGETEY